MVNYTSSLRGDGRYLIARADNPRHAVCFATSPEIADRIVAILEARLAPAAVTPRRNPRTASGKIRWADRNPGLNCQAAEVWTLVSAYRQASARDVATERLTFTATHPRCALIVTGKTVAEVKAGIAEATLLTFDETIEAAAQYEIEKLDRAEKAALAKQRRLEKAAARAADPVAATQDDLDEAIAETEAATEAGLVWVAAVSVTPAQTALGEVAGQRQHAEAEAAAAEAEREAALLDLDHTPRPSLRQIVAERVAADRLVPAEPYLSCSGGLRVTRFWDYTRVTRFYD